MGRTRKGEREDTRAIQYPYFVYSCAGRNERHATGWASYFRIGDYAYSHDEPKRLILSASYMESCANRETIRAKLEKDLITTAWYVDRDQFLFRGVTPKKGILIPISEGTALKHGIEKVVQLWKDKVLMGVDSVLRINDIPLRDPYVSRSDRIRF